WRAAQRHAVFMGKRLPQYVKERDGAWHLWFRRDLWNSGVWDGVRQLIAEERPSKHPRTVELRVSGAQQPLFVKTFFATSAFASLKDCLRRSKAVCALFVAQELHGFGFNAPIAIGAGDERYGAFLRRAFLVTLPVQGCSLPQYLRDRFDDPRAGLAVRQKRETVARLAVEIKKFHDLGFVHGDLVPGNIFVTFEPSGTARFCFMDNDRTCRYPIWLRQRLWRRNLVQLNRFPLAGISLQDRMRFFHAYVKLGELGPKERKLARWLEEKTRQRRKECDAVDTSRSFRMLMRWDGPAH
ncbi:MAG: lipopolysaccharide kinase InaA family protein, partial [Candidatus Binatia bacterium]